MGKQNKYPSVFIDVEQSGLPQGISQKLDPEDAKLIQELYQKHLKRETEFQNRELSPDDYETGDTIRTPRGTFSVTKLSQAQMEAAGYGFHHQSADGKYLIMANGSRAFAIRKEKER